MEKIAADLDWFRVTLVTILTGGGGYGLFRLFKLFNTDFLAPYRSELGDLRDESNKAREEAKQAMAEIAQTRVDLYQCQEREQRLRLDLIKAGINIPQSEDP